MRNDSNQKKSGREGNVYNDNQKESVVIGRLYVQNNGS